MASHSVSSQPLSFQVLEQALKSGSSLVLSDESKNKIERCRKYLDEKLASSDAAIYGINTGFGSLYNRNIPKDQLEQLQENLVMSHACGTGADVPWPELGATLLAVLLVGTVSAVLPIRAALRVPVREVLTGG